MQVAVGGSEAGGWTVGAGVPLGAVVAVGAGVAVGFAVGVGDGVALGVALGLAGAAGTARMIQTLLTNVRPLDPVVYGSVALFFGLVAALACFVPSLRASRIDPLIALGDRRSARRGA